MDHSLISSEQMRQITTMSKEVGKSKLETAFELNLATEKKILKLLSTTYSLPIVDLKPYKVDEKLKKIVEKDGRKKISLATLYNTVHAFKKSGYLKEISLKGNKTFFDTNTKNHHHFYDEDTEKLLDIKNEEILVSKVPNTPTGKKIKEVEVIVRIESDNHN